MDISRKFRLTLICAACAFLSAVSCRQERGIIPEDVMSRIYYDMYMTDEAIKSDNRFRRMTDTLLVYEPIFRRYGYTSEDYTRSVGYYLEHTDIYQEIFERTGQMMEKREAELKAILEAESNTPVRWSIIDSLDILTADGIHSPLYYKYMRILFFKPDTALLRSPMPDSAAYGRPQNPFMLFSDSALNAYRNFEFFKTDGFMNELDTAPSGMKPADRSMTPRKKPLPLKARPQTIQLDEI